MVAALLAPDEGPAVEIREGGGAFVVVCEHASNRVPKALGTLGLSPPNLERHIAWDPGAAELAAGIAGRLAGTTVMQRFSRLVIDCNRDPGDSDAIAAFSEDTRIPANLDLTPDDFQRRVAALWTPFHAALEQLLERRKAARRLTGLATIHSFTPVYRGVSRPWHVGIISTAERSLADAMLGILRRDKHLIVGDNQPYSSKDRVDYTIRRHGRDRGLPHVMIEVRNDLLRAAKDIAAWGERLADALRESAGVVGLAPSAGAKVAT
jgi:predicted N-formylglutamate amidohydrolase